jgi:hypothetical protein
MDNEDYRSLMLKELDNSNRYEKVEEKMMQKVQNKSTRYYNRMAHKYVINSNE